MDEINLKIIERVKMGDEKVFPILLSKYNNYLIKIISKYFYNSENYEQNIEDAIQEIWIKVFKYIYTLNDIIKFPSWLAKIAKNQCLNMLKKTNKTTKIDCNDLDNLTSNQQISDKLKEELFKSHIKEIINNSIDELLEIYAIPIKLFYLKGYKLKEIKKITNIPITTLKWRLFKGRKLLKEKLEESLITK